MAKDLKELAVLLPGTPELQAKIRAELNEDESGRERDIGIIRAWLDQQPHLPRIDDELILKFLRGCKFSLEKCKRKLEVYFHARAATVQVFGFHGISSMKETIQKSYQVVMPRLSPSGHRVSVQLCRQRNGCDGGPPNLRDIFRIWFMLYDIRLREEQGPVAGDVYVIDGRLTTPAYVAQWTPSLIRDAVNCLPEEALPIRVQRIHIVYSHPLVSALFNFVKTFLKEKIGNRVVFHGSDLESLYDEVPRECLPTELGGTGDSIEDLSEAWQQKLLQYEEWFRQQDDLKVDESLRPEKSCNYDEMFGSEGSFRKINID